jgi:hypothetical protein
MVFGAAHVTASWINSHFEFAEFKKELAGPYHKIKVILQKPLPGKNHNKRL